MAQERGILTKSQQQALEQAQTIQETHGEIETLRLGYLGAQDTYYVGHIKGIGKNLPVNLYRYLYALSDDQSVHRKECLITADRLNDRILPFYEQQQVLLLRVLTDRDSEYGGKRETVRHAL